MSKVYNVIDNNNEQGIDVMTFKNKDDAIKAYNETIKDYKEAYKEFDQESEITETWATIIVSGDEVARVFWQDVVVQ